MPCCFLSSALCLCHISYPLSYSLTTLLLKGGKGVYADGLGLVKVGKKRELKMEVSHGMGGDRDVRQLLRR